MGVNLEQSNTCILAPIQAYLSIYFKKINLPSKSRNNRSELTNSADILMSHKPLTEDNMDNTKLDTSTCCSWWMGSLEEYITANKLSIKAKIKLQINWKKKNKQTNIHIHKIRILVPPLIQYWSEGTIFYDKCWLSGDSPTFHIQFQNNIHRKCFCLIASWFKKPV